MPTPITLIIAIFATYRLARLISLDEGPGEIFTQLRAWMGAYDYDEYGLPKTTMGRLISCPHCTGVYLALIVMILIIHPTASVAELLLLWMGIAGAQSFLQTFDD